MAPPAQLDRGGAGDAPVPLNLLVSGMLQVGGSGGGGAASNSMVGGGGGAQGIVQAVAVDASTPRALQPPLPRASGSPAPQPLHPGLAPTPATTAAAFYQLSGPAPVAAASAAAPAPPSAFTTSAAAPMPSAPGSSAASSGDGGSRPPPPPAGLCAANLAKEPTLSSGLPEVVLSALPPPHPTRQAGGQGPASNGAGAHPHQHLTYALVSGGAYYADDRGGDLQSRGDPPSTAYSSPPSSVVLSAEADDPGSPRDFTGMTPLTGSALGLALATERSSSLETSGGGGRGGLAGRSADSSFASGLGGGSPQEQQQHGSAAVGAAAGDGAPPRRDGPALPLVRIRADSAGMHLTELRVQVRQAGAWREGVRCAQHIACTPRVLLAYGAKVGGRVLFGRIASPFVWEGEGRPGLAAHPAAAAGFDGGGGHIGTHAVRARAVPPVRAQGPASWVPPAPAPGQQPRFQGPFESLMDGALSFTKREAPRGAGALQQQQQQPVHRSPQHPALVGASPQQAPLPVQLQQQQPAAAAAAAPALAVPVTVAPGSLRGMQHGPPFYATGGPLRPPAEVVASFERWSTTAPDAQQAAAPMAVPTPAAPAAAAAAAPLPPPQLQVPPPQQQQQQQPATAAQDTPKRLAEASNAGVASPKPHSPAHPAFFTSPDGPHPRNLEAVPTSAASGAAPTTHTARVVSSSAAGQGLDHHHQPATALLHQHAAAAPAPAGVGAVQYPIPDIHHPHHHAHHHHHTTTRFASGPDGVAVGGLKSSMSMQSTPSLMARSQLHHVAPSASMQSLQVG